MFVSKISVTYDIPHNSRTTKRNSMRHARLINETLLIKLQYVTEKIDGNRNVNVLCVLKGEEVLTIFRNVFFVSVRHTVSRVSFYVVENL